jgi:DNA replication protein DnaD
MSYINSILKKYREEGLKAVGEAHYVGNHRNMTVEEEATLLAPFEKEMKAGE